jgi:hypothetical protein
VAKPTKQFFFGIGNVIARPVTFPLILIASAEEARFDWRKDHEGQMHLRTDDGPSFVFFRD